MIECPLTLCSCSLNTHMQTGSNFYGFHAFIHLFSIYFLSACQGPSVYISYLPLLLPSYQTITLSLGRSSHQPSILRPQLTSSTACPATLRPNCQLQCRSRHKPPLKSPAESHRLPNSVSPSCWPDTPASCDRLISLYVPPILHCNHTHPQVPWALALC